MDAELEEYARVTNAVEREESVNGEESVNAEEPVFEKYGLDTPSFTMHAVLVTQGRVKFVRDNGSQDAIHKIKLCCRNLLATRNQRMVFFGFSATRKFFKQLFHNFPRVGLHGHGLRVEDAQYTDRQDFLAVQNRHGIHCRSAMLRLQPRDSFCMRATGDESGFVLNAKLFPAVNSDPDSTPCLKHLHFKPKPVPGSGAPSASIQKDTHDGTKLQHTQAVVTIQFMLAAFILATQSLTLKVRQRVRLLGFVTRILRRLRQHVQSTDGLTIQNNFCPAQTYAQSLLCAHCHINIDRAFRDFCPNVRQVHSYSGEDEAESVFSRAGGNCEVRTWARKYNFKGLLDSIDRMHYIQWASTGAHGERVQTGRSQHIKQEYKPALFERSEDIIRDRSRLPPIHHETDLDMIKGCTHTHTHSHTLTHTHTHTRFRCGGTRC